MSHFKTDKITYHRYFQRYVQLAGILGPDARVCEVGVESGESLRMWQALFPLGDITGVDHNEYAQWPEGTRKIIASQDDHELPGKLGGEFDLIVDDASHDGTLTRKTFDNLWPIVSPGGYYVIEDWTVALRSDPHWGQSWGDSMLRCVESLLPLLDARNGECESIEYRYGMAILHKRSGE